MKILIYSLNFSPEMTGIGKYTGDLALYLSSKGHSLRIITAPPYYPSWKISSNYSKYFYKIEKISNFSVIRCPLYVPSKLNGLKRLFHLFSFAMFSFPVMFYSAGWRPDVILTIEPPLFISPACLLSAKLCKAKSWLHIQDFEVDAAFDLGIIPVALRKYVEYFEKCVLSKFTRVSTISEKMMMRVERKGVPSGNTVYFPNWCDTQEIYPKNGPNPVRQELCISDGSVVALYSGNMGEKQGLEIIIDAAKRLIGTDLVFVMCGTGAAYNRLRESANDLVNIRWIPLQPIERLNDLLNMADVHLLPQRADAADLVMPSKLTGMMASGRSILATAFEGTQVAEVLKVSGIVVPPGDVNAFVEALQYLAHDRVLRDQLGAEARRYAVEHWDKENVLMRFEKSLKDLVY